MAAVRRGLPRSSGGEPWPPAQQAPGVDDATPDVAAEALAVPRARRGLPRPGGPLQETTAPAPAPTAARTTRSGLPRPAAPAAPARMGLPRPATERPATERPGPASSPAPPSSRPVRPAPSQPERPSAFAVLWSLAVPALLAGFVGLILAGAAVIGVRMLLAAPAVQDFMTAYPGEYHLPAGAEPGFPAWVQWQHFLTAFLMVLIIRSGWQLRTQKRPPMFWTPRWSKEGQGKISITLWLHLALDILWIANGVTFIVLLFVTGHWMRIVPTSWEVIPNAVSAALQYASLEWPTHDGWVNYNSLQQVMYFVTVFIAAPLAILTGVRMSALWPQRATRLNRLYPVEWARAIHFPVMLYFVVFIITHVTLVLATGALRNLNHIYGGTDTENWAGFWLFLGSLVVIAVGLLAARPLVLAPIATLTGKVSSR